MGRVSTPLRLCLVVVVALGCRAGGPTAPFPLGADEPSHSCAGCAALGSLALRVDYQKACDGHEPNGCHDARNDPELWLSIPHDPHPSFELFDAPYG